jgi:hypothetical protein
MGVGRWSVRGGGAGGRGRLGVGGGRPWLVGGSRLWAVYGRAPAVAARGCGWLLTAMAGRRLAGASGSLHDLGHGGWFLVGSGGSQRLRQPAAFDVR